MTITMTVDRPATTPWGRFRWEEAARIWAREASPLGLQLLRANAPFRTGAFRQSITARSEPGPASWMIVYYSTLSYARFILDGSRPHVIAARNAKVLHWLGPGGIGDHFARQVKHPGTKPNPFPERLGAAGPAFARLFAEAVKEAMEL